MGFVVLVTAVADLFPIRLEVVVLIACLSTAQILQQKQANDLDNLL